MFWCHPPQSLPQINQPAPTPVRADETPGDLGRLPAVSGVDFSDDAHRDYLSCAVERCKLPIRVYAHPRDFGIEIYRPFKGATSTYPEPWAVGCSPAEATRAYLDLVSTFSPSQLPGSRTTPGSRSAGAGS